MMFDLYALACGAVIGGITWLVFKLTEVRHPDPIWPEPAHVHVVPVPYDWEVDGV